MENILEIAAKIQSLVFGVNVIDPPFMLKAELAVTVEDAHPQCGVRGAARDICELIMSAQGTLGSQFQKYLGSEA